jgi:hypothetical protein
MEICNAGEKIGKHINWLRYILGFASLSLLLDQKIGEGTWTFKFTAIHSTVGWGWEETMARRHRQKKSLLCQGCFWDWQQERNWRITFSFLIPFFVLRDWQKGIPVLTAERKGRINDILVWRTDKETLAHNLPPFFFSRSGYGLGKQVGLK